jgi:hemerythrin-like domain-containing protein
VTARSGGVDTHEMLLIHRVIRREMGCLPALFRSASGDPLRAKVVAAHATEMLHFVQVHHTGEDQLLWPVLRPRVTLDAELIDRMEAQHAEIAAGVEQVQRDLPTWTGDAPAAERMASRIESVLEVLTAHLAEEEQRILPLVAEHFGQDEWDALGKHGMGSIPGKRRLVILGYILDDADDAERTRFLARVPPPARLAYKVIGRRQYAREVSAIHR